MARQKICDEDALWIQETINSGRRHPNGKRIYKTWLAAEYGISIGTLANIEKGRGTYKHLSRSDIPSAVALHLDQLTPEARVRQRLYRPHGAPDKIKIPAFLCDGPHESRVNIDEATLSRSPILRQVWTSALMSARTVARHVRRIINQ